MIPKSGNRFSEKIARNARNPFMRMPRIVLLVGLLALGPVLSACADFDMDKLDIFGLNEKKKLPGERKDVFPEGVPGVSQGIPPEYMKGYQPPPDTPVTPEGAAATGNQPEQKAAAVQPAPQEPKPRAKPKRKPKPRVAAPAQPVQQDQQQAPQQQPAQGQQQWPAPAQNTGNSPWQSAPPPSSGTFSR